MSEPAAPRQRVKPSTPPAVPLGRDESSLRYTKLDESPGSAHTLLLELVPEDAHVLDVGCATGYLAKALIETRSCRVTGIEISPKAAELARRYCERVIVGDVETLDLDSELGDNRFRAIVFGDVLEHLRDPAQTLTRVRPFLDDAGSVIASIPNIAHGSVRLALLAGEFRYREQGLLDRTHLRFFTHEGIQDMFEESGYVLTTWRRRRLEISEVEIGVPASVPDEARAALSHDTEASTYQFVIRAVPSDVAAQLKGLREELEELRPMQERVVSLEAEIASLDGELTAVRQSHRELQRRVVAERAAFSNHAHELIEQLEPLTEELAWRTEAMKHQHEEIEWRKQVIEDREARLAAIEESWVFRYSAPARKMFGRLRRGK